MRYQATFSTHLNFYPGSMTPTPADYRYILGSEPRETRGEAESDLFAGRSAMDHPEDWSFDIREVE